jgi:hypothetical protein
VELKLFQLYQGREVLPQLEVNLLEGLQEEDHLQAISGEVVLP